MTRFFLLLLLSVCAASSWAQANNGSDLNGARKPERGWFYFEKTPVPEDAPPPETATAPKTPPPPKEDKCKKKETWTVDCGFVNPGADFQFQAKQRDELMERMSVAKNDPKAVEAFQYYMRYVIERTSEVTNNWWYNMVQNPELDPSVAQPISAFGIRLMTEAQQGKDKEVFSLIKSEGGFLVYFTRSDCNFCHQMADSVVQLSQKTGLTVRNAALDDKCLPQFLEGCITAPRSTRPAEYLQVTTVPSVFLYIPPKTWIRVATGVVDVQSMLTRTSQFFAAYRSALLNGVENGGGGRASVDFSTTEVNGASKGVTVQKPTDSVPLPDQAEISKMLGINGSK